MNKLFLHIGIMKSGTTFLQNILLQNKDHLKNNNIIYPGEHLNHQHAMYGLCGSDIPWVCSSKPYEHLSNTLLGKLKKIDSDVILSSEALSSMNKQGIKKLLYKIGTPYKVIITVRDLSSVLPSAWQQWLKTGSEKTFSDTLTNFKSLHNDLSGIWKTYAYGEIVKLWSEFANIEVIIVDSANQNKLTIWKDFCEALEVAPLLDVNVPASESNLSLDYESAEILRYTNLILKSKDLEFSNRFRKFYLDKVIFKNTENRQSKIKIPDAFYECIEMWNTEEIKKTKTYSSKIIGTSDALKIKKRKFGNAPESDLTYLKAFSSQIIKIFELFEKR